jgi:type IV fimbrial biogenesis protein FimT
MNWMTRPALNGQPPFQTQIGATLIEIIVVLTIAATFLAYAAPAFTDMLDRYRVKAATERLYLYLHHAKSEAIKRNRRIRLTFKSSNGGATWCYGLKIETTCDCNTEGSCEIDGAQKVIRNDEFPGVKIETHISAPGDRLTFENMQWIMAGTYGHIRLYSSRGKQVRVIVSRTSRLRLCSPAGNTNVSGYSTSC